jgi:2-hydroxyacyl-CoA lyase 1
MEYEMNYLGFRNEQAASYAAGMVGYMTKRPAVCLAVSGPGMTNTISGMAEAMVNKRPMIVIGGASDTGLDGRGAFQELDQISCAKPVTKYAARPHSIRNIPIVVERAVRYAMYGNPGACYIDLPNDLLYSKMNDNDIVYPARVELFPAMILPEPTVDATIDLLKNAKTPLVIVGKGIAYGDAQAEMREFIEKSNIPFLATPMGKGVVRDDDEHNAGSARSYIL